MDKHKHPFRSNGVRKVGNRNKTQNVQNKVQKQERNTTTVYKFKKTTNLASQDDIIPRHFVMPIKKDPLRLMSVAAKGTTVLINSSICVDAGNLPFVMGNEVLLLLITHGHADHVKDVCNAFGDRDGKVLTLFCPAINALDLFHTIRLTHQINKGRSYTTEDILPHLRIYGVVRPNDKQFDRTNEIVCQTSGLPVVTLVKVGEIVEVDMAGRSKCGVRPFHCHHTVDTVGYGIYDSTMRLNQTIRIPKGVVSEITPPKMTKADKKEYKRKKAEAVAAARAANADGIIDPNLDRIDFESVYNFVNALNLPDDLVKTSIVSREMGKNGFILDSIRRIEFIDDLILEAFDSTGTCILPKEAFIFFKEYATDMDGIERIKTSHKALTPSVMVFGDTGATVFSQQLVRDMVSEFPRVIIESTFLDGEDVLSKVGVPATDPDLDGLDTDMDTESPKPEKKEKNAKRNLYLRLKEKKHIFLPELYYLFGKHSDTEFVLMHFSDRYDKESVRAKAAEIQQTYPNVYFAV